MQAHAADEFFVLLVNESKGHVRQVRRVLLGELMNLLASLFAGLASDAALDIDEYRLSVSHESSSLCSSPALR
jgi:hypothetical protein